MSQPAARRQQGDAINELRRRLGVIESIFDTRRLSDRGKDSRDIVRYYSQSARAYLRFHSAEGAVHMALNPDGDFDRAGYLGQVKLVEAFIGGQVRRVLELGCGYGFNMRHLATNHPGTEFIGVDLVARQVAFACRRSRELRNITYQVGDFQSLQLPDASVDLGYSIESFCHATDLKSALSEAHRVLVTGGRLVIVDAWRTDAFPGLPEPVRRAAAYTESAMSVGRPNQLDAWREMAELCGFKLVNDQELTHQILPNLRRFERMADLYLRHGWLARLGLRLLPERLLANAIAAYLMPLTVELGAHTYRMVAVAKTARDPH